MNTFITFYSITALTVCGVGLLYKLLYYLKYVINKPWLPIIRAENPLPPLSNRSLSESWWMATLAPYRFWWQANPVIFIGHVFYHVGLFLAIGTYVLVMVTGYGRMVALPTFGHKVLFVCDWFSQKTPVFTIPWVDQIMHNLFFLALVSAVIGISTPLIMSVLKKRGAIRPVDSIMEGLGIKSVTGLSSQQRGRARRVVGIMVLIMDIAMVVSFLMPHLSEYTCFIHVMFAMNIVAMLPTTFLFHEINRAGAMRAAYHHRYHYVP